MNHAQRPGRAPAALSGVGQKRKKSPLFLFDKAWP